MAEVTESDTLNNYRGLTIANIPTSVEYNSVSYSVKSIGQFSFGGSWGLTSVTIGNGITSIGYGAFYCCFSLTSITISNSVTSIGDDAFNGCSSLTSINVERGNTMYDSRNNCNAIIETATNTLMVGCQNTIIPNSVTSIEDLAFYECSSLTSVTIPYSVLSIGEFAFYKCSNLTSVLIPNSIPNIKRGAFAGCNKLKEIIIPQGTKQRFEQMEGLNGLQALLVEK